MANHEEGFLFPADQEKQARDRERERRRRIFGTPEFWFAYRKYMQTTEWRKLCKAINERASNRCERCPPDIIQAGRLSVHHLTYDRFMNETLTDLQLLCDYHHELADREREQQMRAAYEAAGEEAMDAAGMNTYFTKRMGSDWVERFGNHIEDAYQEWEEWKKFKAEEEGYDYY